MLIIMINKIWKIQAYKIQVNFYIIVLIKQTLYNKVLIKQTLYKKVIKDYLTNHKRNF